MGKLGRQAMEMINVSGDRARSDLHGGWALTGTQANEFVHFERCMDAEDERTDFPWQEMQARVRPFATEVDQD